MRLSSRPSRQWPPTARRMRPPLGAGGWVSGCRSWRLTSQWCPNGSATQDRVRREAAMNNPASVGGFPCDGQLRLPKHSVPARLRAKSHNSMPVLAHRWSLRWSRSSSGPTGSPSACSAKAELRGGHVLDFSLRLASSTMSCVTWHRVRDNSHIMVNCGAPSVQGMRMRRR